MLRVLKVYILIFSLVSPGTFYARSKSRKAEPPKKKKKKAETNYSKKTNSKDIPKPVPRKRPRANINMDELLSSPPKADSVVSDYVKVLQAKLQLELMRLNKCYSILARIRPEDDPDADAQALISEIKNTSNYMVRRELVVNACMNLIERASLSPASTKTTNRVFNGTGSSESAWEVNQDDYVAVNVFKSFHDVHLSWVNNVEIDGNASFREPVESALRNNLALFSEDYDQWIMLSGNRYYGAVRDGGIPQSSHPLTFNYSGYIDSPMNNIIKWNQNTHWTQLPFMSAEYLVKLSNQNELKITNLNLMDDEGKKQLNFQKTNRSEFWGRVALPLSVNPLEHFTDDTLFDSAGNSLENAISLMPPLVHNNKNSISLINSLNNTENPIPITWDKESAPAQCVPQLLERGFIVGVKEMPSEGSCLFEASETLPNTRSLWSRRQVNANGYDFYFHADGGMLGNISYILQNHDYISLQSMVFSQSHYHNGHGFARTWATNVINDFLCRSTPIITPEVDRSLLIGVDPEELESLPSHSYRGAGSCMSCHSTLDFMGASLRNIVIGTLNDDPDSIKNSRWLPKSYTEEDPVTEIELNSTFNSYKTASLLSGGKHNFGHANTPSLMWSVRNTNPQDEDGISHSTNQPAFAAKHHNTLYPSYYTGEDADENNAEEKLHFEWYWPTIEPRGRLVMHDINGESVNLEVSGLEELGEKLMDTPDFHACYAKRYFKFLTGQDILMFSDFMETENSLINPYRYGGLLTLTQLDKWESIKSWGNQLLNKSLDLKGVIKEIIKSDYFIESLKGVPKGMLASTEVISVSELSALEIIDSHCTGCHGGIVDFMSGTSEERPEFFHSGQTLSDYLTKGSPCDSLIYTSIDPQNLVSPEGESLDSCPNTGTRAGNMMPQEEAPLSAEEILKVRKWIRRQNFPTLGGK
ncbi:MAG: hypothetical protein CME61_05200 [Halobacteriovoraceae bacterium]|nr:hypothetical protein [Halobacteriovoraceae bacterium]